MGCVALMLVFSVLGVMVYGYDRQDVDAPMSDAFVEAMDAELLSRNTNSFLQRGPTSGHSSQQYWATQILRLGRICVCPVEDLHLVGLLAKLLRSHYPYPCYWCYSKYMMATWRSRLVLEHS